MNEAAIYIPYKCKITLSRMELDALNNMMLRVRIDNHVNLEQRALFEWAMKKRFEWTRRMMDGKKKYRITLGSQDALILKKIISNVAEDEDYEQVLVYDINDKIGREI